MKVNQQALIREESELRSQNSGERSGGKKNILGGEGAEGGESFFITK